MVKNIEDIKRNYLFEQYRIIPNAIYEIEIMKYDRGIERYDESRYKTIQGKVIMFDGQQMILETINGINMICRKSIKNMYMADMTEEEFSQKQNEILDKYININVKSKETEGDMECLVKKILLK